MKWLRSKTALVVLVGAVAALAIAVGTWQGWPAQAAPDTYIVNDSLASIEPECGTPNWNTTDISSVIALTEVEDGDTLVLCEGTYDPGINVDKKITIEGQADVDIDKIVIDGSAGVDDGINVNADDVTIRHLTLVGPVGGLLGIDIGARTTTTITDVDLTDWDRGVEIGGGATDTTVQASNIHGNVVGIDANDSTGTRILNNNGIVDNDDYGVVLDEEDLAVVADNVISGNDIYQLRIINRSHVQVLRNTIVTGSQGVYLDLPAEALVIIGGSDANANTFDGPLDPTDYYIELQCANEATVNATHNYWKGPPAVSRGVAGVIFNDEDDDPVVGPDCPLDDHGAVVFHPVATGPAPTPTPVPTPTGTPTPTPTVVGTPTPSPTPPADTRTFDLQMGWNNFVWTGPSDTEPATVLACIEGNYIIAYRFVALNQSFQRYVPDNAALSNMTNLNEYDNLMVLVTASGVQCQDMPVGP